MVGNSICKNKGRKKFHIEFGSTKFKRAMNNPKHKHACVCVNIDGSVFSLSCSIAL